MPAGSIALDFILRSKYLQIREPCCAIGDVSNRAYHYITREIVDHAAAHHQIEAAIGQKLRQIVDRSPHYVTARSEPAYRVFTWIDALISRGRSKVPDHRLPATLARTHIQHGADRMRQHVLGRGQREADQSLEIGGRPHAMLRMAIPLVEVAPVKTLLFDHDVGGRARSVVGIAATRAFLLGGLSLVIEARLSGRATRPRLPARLVDDKRAPDEIGEARFGQLAILQLTARITRHHAQLAIVTQA